MRELARETIVSTMAAGRPVLRVSVEKALADGVAGLQYLHLERLRLVWRQLWPDTATGRWLDRHASIWAVTRKQAGGAVGKVKFTGADGAAVPAGVVVESDGGIQYETQANAVLVGGEGYALVDALSEGLETNLAPNTELTMVSELVGVDGVVGVVVGDQGEDGLVGGVEVEGDGSLRDRLLARIGDPPKAGHESDYEEWAREVIGVTRAWAFAGVNGPGTVLVLGVSDATETIMLSEAKQDEIYSHLKDPDLGVAPATDLVSVGTPPLRAIDMTIVLSPNTAEVQAAVTARLKGLFRLWDLTEDVVYLSKIAGAIDSANGENWHTLLTPAANVDLATYELPVVGVLTFEDP